MFLLHLLWCLVVQYMHAGGYVWWCWEMGEGRNYKPSTSVWLSWEGFQEKAVFQKLFDWLNESHVFIFWMKGDYQIVS